MDKNNEYKIHKEEPELTDILEQIKLNVSANLNCHNIGKIIEFDKDTQTCTVELMQLKQFNGMTYLPAPISQVPLVIYGAGGGHITLPNPVGTICLLFFNDRNMDNFMLTGEQYTPDTTRMHDFTDCIAITTFKTLANPLNNYDERAVSIINEEIINEIKYSSYIKVYGDSILINSTDTNNGNETNISITPSDITEVTTDITVTANNIDFNSDDFDLECSNDININSKNYTNSVSNKIIHHSTLGASINIDERISITNTTQNLNLLLQSLLTACEGITINTATGLLTEESRAAFTNLKTQFLALLK